jgi:hypothetical protein
VSKYVEFPLESGGSIVIESADEPGRSSTGFVRGDEQARQSPDAASQSLDASVEAVRRSAELIVSKLRSLSAVPDDMVVSFALKASGDLGSLAVAKSGSDANFHVTLKWESEREKDREKERDDDHEKAPERANPADEAVQREA